jgi:NADH-quinone oxidoreductase subunit F
LWCWTYICGEETALIESLEGKEEILVSNHFPAISGLWANPTVVNNVETIAAVPWIVNNSGAEYAKIGMDVLQEQN